MSTTATMMNTIFYIHTKLIEIRYHFIKVLKEQGEIELKFCELLKNNLQIFYKINYCGEIHEV